MRLEMKHNIDYFKKIWPMRYRHGYRIREKYKHNDMPYFEMVGHGTTYGKEYL